MKKAVWMILGVTTLALGCEIISHTDHTTVAVTDGSVSAFETRQGNIVITAPPRDQPQQ
ncbi:MAG: hypothetical protein R6X19_08825 [Kiritimatiellia bacterium]